MESQNVYPVPEQFANEQSISLDSYQQMYSQSIQNSEQFWAEMASKLHWFTPFSKVKDCSYNQDNLHIRWFEDGQTNASYNCLDRHLTQNADKTAIIWEGDNPAEQETLTYAQLHQRVCRSANLLKSLGVVKGDVVTLYMPMVPEALILMLACSRIGAIHSVIFGGFSADSIATRVNDGQSKLVITADEGLRGGKTIPLKATVDAALANPLVATVTNVLVYKRTNSDINWVEGRDLDYLSLVEQQSSDCPAETMNAEDPLFILYTSGSTGNPKGVLHSTGGYLVYAQTTFKHIFDHRDDDVFWCTADVGWITGHSYMAYGPLLNGATILMHEGVPNYPDSSRLADMIDRHKVSILYTAPTLIRALMAHGESYFDGLDGQSLRLMGSVGEPINPEAWRWYHNVIGKGCCPIVDTWWQTETGGVLIAPLPSAVAAKPGSATLPFFGVQPAIVDNEGNILDGACEGNLVILDSWPGQMRSVYGDHQRFVDTYFKTFPGMYFTGDGARRDEDGYYWITGRVDDVLNVSGHRLGTAEIESALVSHPQVAEAAVVGYPHAIKGQGIYTYVTLNDHVEPTSELMRELKGWVRQEIGALATPDKIQWAPGLPKTRSGKIMRRFLRKIAADEVDQLGDSSTLADPSVLTDLIAERQTD